MIMEDGKSQCLQGELASWRHRRINGFFPKALRSKTQEETTSQIQSKAGSIFLCLGEAAVLCLGEAFLCLASLCSLQAFNSLDRSIHIREGNGAFSD